jgi:hypothetical protein
MVQKTGDSEHCVFLEWMYLLTRKYISPRAETAYSEEETRPPCVKDIHRKPQMSTLQHTDNEEPFIV